jgi:predicted RecA/RadA family phage recombinase
LSKGERFNPLALCSFSHHHINKESTMKNFVQHGKVLDLAAPAGGVVAGVPYQIGSFFGVAGVNADAGVVAPFAIEGVFNNLPKTTGAAWTDGIPLYFDPATGKLTTVAGALKKVAIGFAALSADAVGSALLVPTV